MIYAAPFAAAFAFALFAAGASRLRRFPAARAAATLVCLVALIALAIAWVVGGRGDAATTPGSSAGIPGLPGLRIALSDRGFIGLAPVLISAIGVVALGMSDAVSHRVATLRRIMALLAVALAFVAVRDARLLAILWTASPWIVWSELRARFGDRGVARLFALYHAAGASCFLAATALGHAGSALLAPLLLLVAIGIREAVIPGHSWFPRFVERAPLGLVVAFVAPQLGVFAQIEVLGAAIPPELAAFIPRFGGATALLAAALGVVQVSARRSLAYLLMSQTALVSLGLDGSSEVARTGSLLAWQVLALATTGLAMTISALEARRGALSLATHSGYFARTPRMAAGFMLMGLASVGFPMTLGFVAEDLLAQGAIEQHPVWAFVLIGATALNGMSVMRAFFRLFSGRRVHTGETDLTARESFALSLVLLVLLVGGMLPSLLLSPVFGHGETHALSASPPALLAVGAEPGDH